MSKPPYNELARRRRQREKREKRALRRQTKNDLVAHVLVELMQTLTRDAPALVPRFSRNANAAR
jgi:hypothetical protein